MVYAFRVRALGIDYGKRRIGLALSDATGLLARPWKTIAASGEPARVACADHAVAVAALDAEIRRVAVRAEDATRRTTDPLRRVARRHQRRRGCDRLLALHARSAPRRSEPPADGRPSPHDETGRGDLDGFELTA